MFKNPGLSRRNLESTESLYSVAISPSIYIHAVGSARRLGSGGREIKPRPSGATWSFNIVNLIPRAVHILHVHALYYINCMYLIPFSKGLQR